MLSLIAGLLLFWLASAGLKLFVKASPAKVAFLVRKGGAVLAFGLAALLLVRGQIEVAIGVAALGWWLMSGRRPNLRGAFTQGLAGAGLGGPSRRPRISRVRSAMIEMELDLGSGVMSGSVLAGPDEGTMLDQLGRQRCFALYRRCTVDDPEGARLLEAYFDRRFAGWRQTEDAGRDPRGGSAGRGRVSAMSEDEAQEVLGLAKSATREEITRAHRALMKKFHPDHGGSTDLAARVNEAKDVLMRRHP